MQGRLRSVAAAFYRRSAACSQFAGAPTPLLATARSESTRVEKKNDEKMVYMFDAKGSSRLEDFTKQTAAQMRLQSRDLRCLELYQQPPTILCRQHAIIINLMHIKAVIQHNRMMVFPNSSAPMTALVATLSAHLQSTNLEYNMYEFRALDVILNSVCDELESLLLLLQPDVVNVLNDLTRPNKPQLDQNHLMRLLAENKRLTEFAKTTSEVRDALMVLLESDEDMAKMYLTTRAFSGHARRTDQHEEVELLLENYLRRVEEVDRESSQLKSFIKDTEDIVNIKLDSQRNDIMRTELQLTMGTFSVSVCGLFAAFFGMNLLSHIEDHPHAFLLVSSSVLMATVSVWRLLLAHGRRKNLW